MRSHFFALMSRMKHINRWGLMNNTKTENICEHSLMVAMLAHALVVISNKRFSTTLDPERVTVLAMYHDASEIITGDMPTPIKYFNPKISEAYKQIERVAEEKLVSYLPEIGNREFSQAKCTIEKSLNDMKLPYVDVFMEEFMPSFYLTLDEQD